MNTIKQTYVIAATPEDVWRALTDPELIQEWSGEPAEFSPEVGAPYSLWSGSIVGEILELAPGERLVKTWRPTDWTRQDSVVRLTLMPEEGTTLVDLVHENVEESDFDGTNEGWDIYYLGAIKRMLEGRTNTKPAKQGNTKPAKKGTKAANTKAAKEGDARAAKKGARAKAASKTTARSKPAAKPTGRSKAGRTTAKSAKRPVAEPKGRP